jgi:hypothetical protein
MLKGCIKKLIRPASGKPGPHATYVKGLDPEVTATSTCFGAINDLLVDVHNITLTHLVMRSGHYHTDICAVFEYIWSSFTLQAQAGHLLGGWPHPKH